MERTAQQVPKPCYAVEFDLSSQVCRECEFQQSCFEALGVRKHKVPLNRVEFKLVPKAFGLDNISVEDPEIPAIERTYILCHQTIFGHRPKDRVGQHKSAFLANVKKAKCSIRMFMLANMVAHQQQQRIIAERTERGERQYYTAKLFTYANAIKRVDMFREMCQKEFGTFNLTSLDTLTEGSYEENDIERKMEHSEFTAARALVGWKIRNSGPGEKNVYDFQELTLDPYWLATEPTYAEVILKPYWAARAGSPERGSKTQANHRFAVSQVIAQMKKKKDWAIAIYQARERVMPRCVERVLHAFGYRAGDFEHDAVPITSAMDFWTGIARAIQHVECLRQIDEGRSIFTR